MLNKKKRKSQSKKKYVEASECVREIEIESERDWDGGRLIYFNDVYDVTSTVAFESHNVVKKSQPH